MDMKRSTAARPPVDFKTGDFGVVLNVPHDVLDPMDTIVVLELAPNAGRR
jgi:hypothetical protein